MQHLSFGSGLNAEGDGGAELWSCYQSVLLSRTAINKLGGEKVSIDGFEDGLHELVLDVGPATGN